MFITYQITHKISKKYYIGKASLRTWNAGYRGSGKTLQKAFRKYGRDAFYHAILDTFNTEEEAFEDEARRVDKETLKDPLCYNLIPGGKGFTTGHKNSEKTKRLISKAISGSKNAWYGKPRTKSVRTKVSKGLTRYWSDKKQTKPQCPNCFEQCKRTDVKYCCHACYIEHRMKGNQNEDTRVRRQILQRH